MSTKTSTQDSGKLEHAWTPIAADDDATAEVLSELALDADADEHTPEEAGYGYGV